MVQEFHVLRCFSCEVFQVQQVKKVKKWSCKVCGQKQSVIKEFGRGSGADCRRHVQKLNAARGAKMEEDVVYGAKMEEDAVYGAKMEEDAVYEAKMEEDAEHRAQVHWKDTEFDEKEQLSHKSVSRWDKYLPAPQEEAGLTHELVEPEEEAVVLDRDLLYPRTQRAKRKEVRCSQRWKRRRTSGQDVSEPGLFCTGPQSPPSPPRTAPTVPSTHAIPSVMPPRAVSKWSTFVETPSASESGSRVSSSSMFQSGEEEDLDLNWI